MNRALVLLAACLFGSAALSQNYPDRVVRIVNTFPAGGSGDAVLRVVFEKVGTARSGSPSSRKRAPARAARSAPNT